jgi:tRNA(Ile)-lysidine synthase
VSAVEPVSSAEAAALFGDLAQARVLMIAVSGGPDSTALLVLAARWRADLRRGPKLVAVTVDHALRPESAAEARAVARLAGKLEVTHRTVRWSGRKPTTGLQAAARTVRYRLLAAAARKAGATHVLAAHTRDDQAETILHRLARGSGIPGLAGMARVAPLPGSPDILLVRPLLALSKDRLVATVRAAEVACVDDPSNRDPRFTRARLRRLMPSLAEEGLDAEKLALLGRRAARADAALEAAVTAALPLVSLTEWSNSGPILIDAGPFARLPAEVGLRVLGRAIALVGEAGPCELGKLESLFAALRKEGGKRFRRTLAGALVTLRDDRLAVERAPARRNRQG